MTAAKTTSPAGAEPDRPGRPLRHGIPLGRWAGVPISAHWSTLVTLLLFAELLAASALPQTRPGGSTATYWIAGVLTAWVFLLTLLAHELAHAIVARHYGMKVDRITLWMLGGLTELDDEPPTPRADALIAVAGPAASIAIGGACAAVVWMIGGTGLAVAALAWLAGASLLIGVFNLLPGAPLDGGRLLRAILWSHYHDRGRALGAAARAGRVLGILLVVVGVVETLAGAMGGLWLALIGWFISSSASNEAAAAGTASLTGLHAREVMSPAARIVPDWWTVPQFLDALTADQALQLVFPLVDWDGQASGAVLLSDLDRVPADAREETRLRDVVHARRAAPLLVDRDVLLTEALAPIRMHAGIAVVVDGDRHPLGVITDLELARATRLVSLGWHGTHTDAA